MTGSGSRRSTHTGKRSRSVVSWIQPALHAPLRAHAAGDPYTCTGSPIDHTVSRHERPSGHKDDKQERPSVSDLAGRARWCTQVGARASSRVRQHSQAPAPDRRQCPGVARRCTATLGSPDGQESPGSFGSHGGARESRRTDSPQGERTLQRRPSVGCTPSARTHARRRKGVQAHVHARRRKGVQ